MTEVLVWILISVSTGHYNYGTTTVIGYFKDLNQCQHVEKHIPTNSVVSNCIQARVLVK